MRVIKNHQKSVADTVEALSVELLKSAIIATQFGGSVDIVGRIRICDGGIMFADVKVEHLKQVKLKHFEKAG